jgi:hypothetical protein
MASLSNCSKISSEKKKLMTADDGRTSLTLISRAMYCAVGDNYYITKTHWCNIFRPDYRSVFKKCQCRNWQGYQHTFCRKQSRATRHLKSLNENDVLIHLKTFADIQTCNEHERRAFTVDICRPSLFESNGLSNSTSSTQ